MSYIGRVEQKASDIRRFNVTGSTSATHTLTWSPPNEQSLIITINGVKQQEDAYSVSGTTLTLTSALVSTDKMEVVGIQDVGETMVPGTGTITNDHISSTAAIAQSKLSLDITNSDVNASAAIALSKLATDPSNASNLASGTVPTARLGSGTADATTFLRGDQSWAEAGGGKVLQVVSSIDNTNTSVMSTTSSSDVDMGSPYSVTLTPAATTSKIIVQAVVPAHFTDGGSYKSEFSFYRDIGGAGYSAVLTNNNGMTQSQGTQNVQYTFQIIDEPSTTSAVTYKLYWKQVSSTTAKVLAYTVRSMYAWEIGA